jgi:glycosyltransferase involved in cell wall biosynthesis
MRVRPPSGASARALLTYLLTLPWTMFQLRQLIIRHDIRVVNAHFPSLVLANFVLLALLGLYSGKLLLSFHGRDIHPVTASRGIDKWLWRWLLHRVDRSVFCSRQLATYLHDFDPELGTATVHNGICLQDLMDEKCSIVPERLPSGPYILNVGAFEHKKGQDVLIRAFALLAPDFPKMHLVLLGQKGPTYDELTALVAALDLQQHVHFGVDVPHGEVLGYLEKAMVFAFPSRSEPLGIAMLEAGVFGLPVVASRTGGIPEVISSEDLGMLVDVDDQSGLELALRKLLTDAELRLSLGKRLQKHVSDEFTWQSAWQKYLALVLNDRPASERAIL